ncbi:MAG: hypothetical protein COV31_02295 [Candidatus Yanofskybacteria bacterium CG10_big_fil_rev_8_21_14_0_10_46_23]|uniref:Antitoxin n=1 Tax=Candidatus Yanofskybacteria bacterium CG10_big_fil_rev_8_21_14_0_10_46_23 TaxID=1975098 RepID=A0A2H0R5X6_9BACT|nr:MAG: hypothetical protein COV31_02295 [Candidatus Yanofskybacteria bacterium CG10_big_fil_rev_8_21_14_0_10_46_23]
MNTEELQQLVNQFGAVVMVKNDRPAFVILPFTRYQELAGQVTSFVDIHSTIENNPKDAELIDRLNNEIAALKEEISHREAEVLNEEEFEDEGEIEGE